MTINKKVKNATVKEYDGLKFRSLLEIFCYKKLKENSLDFTYEQVKVDLIPPFALNESIAVYPPDTGKNTNQLLTRDKVGRMSYTPDFVVYYKDYVVYIEVKGWGNDLLPTKRKLFLRWMENEFRLRNEKPIYLEPHSQKHVIECINFIKELQ